MKTLGIQNKKELKT
uniref:Uncharacterized protein n=1 Tax=Anguilla anguilla TaxID=7936 RepID=A0A0E9SPQ3_ANGAN